MVERLNFKFKKRGHPVETKGFLKFSGCIEMEHWAKMG